MKQEPAGPEEDREENRQDFVSASAPEEETGGVGTPVVSAGGRSHPALILLSLLLSC